ncbi:MAG: hypothetical protein ABJG88_01040 [Litorimonas sp.]
MLKDVFFYPLAGIIIALIIGGALSLGNHDVLTVNDIRQQGFTVEGPDLAGLTAAPGTNYEYIAATPNDPALARLVTTLARDVAPPSPGIFAALNPNYEAAFSQQTLRLTITARSSAKEGLAEFDMAYFTAGSGDSGWKRQTLTSEWAEYSFDFTTGAVKGEGDLDYFSIWPGITGEPLMMDVKRMRIDVLENTDP